MKPLAIGPIVIQNLAHQTNIAKKICLYCTDNATKPLIIEEILPQNLSL